MYFNHCYLIGVIIISKLTLTCWRRARDSVLALKVYNHNPRKHLLQNSLCMVGNGVFHWLKLWFLPFQVLSFFFFAEFLHFKNSSNGKGLTSLL